jgi:hypothetical protein
MKAGTASNERSSIAVEENTESILFAPKGFLVGRVVPSLVFSCIFQFHLSISLDTVPQNNMSSVSEETH